MRKKTVSWATLRKATEAWFWHDWLIDRIDAAEVVVVGVPTLLETAMVLSARLGLDAHPMIFAFLRRLDSGGPTSPKPDPSKFVALTRRPALHG